MSTLVAPIPRHTEHEHIVLEGISWDLYARLVTEGTRRIYMTYSKGRLELMSPLPEHEKWKTIIGDFIAMMSTELNIPMSSYGSTTYQRQDLLPGLEPDECYYVQHEEQMRNKDRIDLANDPPPDLVVEIDISHHEIDREEIYAEMGVGELWIFDGRQLTPYALRRGKYVPIENSLAFPMLKVRDLEPFLARFGKLDQTTIRRQFRDWIRKSTPGR